MSWLGRALVVLLAVSAAGCSRAREYELRGQVIAVDPSRQELTVKHEDIEGFMPAMTMAFKVPDREMLEAREPGELIRAILVVEDTDAHLRGIEHTGYAPVDPTAARRPSFDLLAPGEEVPDVTFVDQHGTERQLSALRGRFVVVTFIYTRCPLPNFCPLMDRHFAALQRKLAADPALRDKVRLLSVSFDPAYDTPEVLAAHAGRAGADARTWSFVTGEVAAIDEFVSRFGVSVIRGEAALDEIVHNLKTALVGADGRLVKVFDGNTWQPDDVLSALRAAGAGG